MGWAGSLVWFPSKHRWTPQKKIGTLQNACPKFISRPQTQSSYKLVSFRMLGLEICLTCTCPIFPGKPSNICPKKRLFYKMAWSTRKKENVQNASVCYKNATGMEHGSSHFIVEIYTWIDLVSLVSLLRYMLLRCRDLWHPCFVATLKRSLVSLLRYMLLRCRDLWYPCFVTCCYAAEISGIIASLHVATLQRSLVSLLRYMLLRCRDLSRFHGELGQS